MTDTTVLIAAAQGDADAWKALAMAAEARCARLAGQLRLAGIRLQICGDRMRGCNSEGGKHELIDEVDEWAADACALSDTAQQEAGDA